MSGRVAPSGGVQFSTAPPLVHGSSAPSGGLSVSSGGPFQAPGGHNPVVHQVGVPSMVPTVRFGPMVTCPRCTWVITLSPQDVPMVGSNFFPLGQDDGMRSGVRVQEGAGCENQLSDVESYEVVGPQGDNNRFGQGGQSWRRTPYAARDGGSSNWQPRRGMENNWQGRESGVANPRYSPELAVSDRRERRSASRHRSRGRQQRRSRSRGNFDGRRSKSRPRADRAYGSRRSAPRDADRRETYYPSRGHTRGPTR